MASVVPTRSAEALAARAHVSPIAAERFLLGRKLRQREGGPIAAVLGSCLHVFDDHARELAGAPAPGTPTSAAADAAPGADAPALGR